jgi:hypothetical protein
MSTLDFDSAFKIFQIAEEIALDRFLNNQRVVITNIIKPEFDRMLGKELSNIVINNCFNYVQKEAKLVMNYCNNLIKDNLPAIINTGLITYNVVNKQLTNIVDNVSNLLNSSYNYKLLAKLEHDNKLSSNNNDLSISPSGELSYNHIDIS